MFSFIILLLLVFFFSLQSTQPITPNGSTQPIITNGSTQPINAQTIQMDQHNRSKTQQIQQATENPQPTTVTHNHGKPQPKSATQKPTKITNPKQQKKIKRKTRSDWRDREPNVTITKLTSSRWPLRARRDATPARINPISEIASPTRPLQSLTRVDDHRELRVMWLPRAHV